MPRPLKRPRSHDESLSTPVGTAPANRDQEEPPHKQKKGGSTPAGESNPEAPVTMGVLKDFMSQLMQVMRPNETSTANEQSNKQGTMPAPTGTVPKKTTQSKPSGSASQNEASKCPTEKVSLGSWAPAPDTVDKSGDTSKPGTSGIPKDTTSASSEDEEEDIDDDEDYDDEDDDTNAYVSDPESFGYDSERESSKNRMAYVSRESFRGAWDVKKYADGSKERFLPIFTLNGQD